jgi:hypothetical protein
MLTCDDRILLTEFLGEKWYEINPQTYGLCPDCKSDDIGPQAHRGAYDAYYICLHCKAEFDKPMKENPRTFTTWQDLGDLKRKIVEMGEWDEFIDFTLEEHGSLGPVFSNEAKFYKADYIDWLMDKIRFPELVAEWWTERKVKG